MTNGTLTDDGSGVVTIDTGAGGGAVDSVNGEVGVVVLDTDDVSEGTVNKYMVLGTSGTTALAGNTTTITGGQATEIADNTLKVGYTDGAVDARIASADLNDLNDVTITGASSGEVLKWSGSEWINGTGGGGATTLDGLSDVDTTGVADKQALVYDNSASEWVAGFPGTSGAVSTFLAESSKVNNYVSANNQNIILGSILSGELSSTADMKAGWTAGFNQVTNATSLVCAQVTAGTTMQMSVKYDITLGTATFAYLTSEVTGNIPALVNFAFHTSDASNVTNTGVASVIVTYQTSNTIKLKVNANGTGTVKILELKAVVVHA